MRDNVHTTHIDKGLITKINNELTKLNKKIKALSNNGK